MDVGDDPNEIDFMLEDAQNFMPTPNPENEEELAVRLAARFFFSYTFYILCNLIFFHVHLENLKATLIFN